MIRDKSRVLDAIDRQIVDVLRADSRISVSELATRVNVSRANAYNRLARLTDEKVIQRFTVDVDARAMGYGITALILMDIDQHAWRAVEDEVMALPGVEYVALTTGTFDVVVLVRAPDMDTLRDVVLERIQSMPAIRSTQTSFVLEERTS